MRVTRIHSVPARRGETRLALMNLGLAAVVGLAALFATGANPPPDVSFAQAKTFAVGSIPRAVAVGDFNRDGKLDIAVVNFNSNNVSVLLGNGDGTFRSSMNFAVNMNPLALTIGDFNGDGNEDLAVAGGFTSGEVSILLGSGTGVFGPAKNYPAGADAQAVAAGDFNKDGKLDLVVANFSTNSVSLLLGNGDGSFQAPKRFTVGANPRSVAVGDFNGDGNLDVATANDSGNSVSVLLGHGDGSFGTAQDFPVGRQPFSLAVGDFNGDGKLDLAVANLSTNNVSILLNKGDGSFMAAANFPAGVGPLSLAVNDFNKDGKLDLAVANPNTNSVAVLLGFGDGTFKMDANLTLPATPMSVTSGDFNGDEKPDLALPLAGNSAAGDSVAILLNTSVVAPPNRPPVANAGPSQTVECSSPNGTMVTLSGSGSDPDGDPLTFKWTDENGTVAGTTAVAQVLVPMGAHTFTLTVNDGRGGTSSDRVVVTVRDTTPPSITISPARITVIVPAVPATRASLDLPHPVVSDACDPAPRVTDDAPASFSTGLRTVTFTATDASGNSAQAKLSVEVLLGFSFFKVVVEIEREGSPGKGQFEARTIFQLGPGNHGLNLVRDVLRFRTTGGAVDIVVELPLSAFRRHRNGHLTFEGILNARQTELKLRPLGGGKFQLKVEIESINLPVITNPLAVELRIGDYIGRVLAIAKIEGESEEHN